MPILTKINFRHGAQGYAKPKKGRGPKMGVVTRYKIGIKAKFVYNCLN